MKLSIFCIGILLFLTNCHDDEILNEKTNSAGEIIALPYHWKKSIHVGGIRNYVGIIYGNLVFDDNIIITISDGPEKRDLTMIDVENGHELWKWNESYQPATESPNFDHYAVYQDILHWIVGSRHYAININTGKTLWRDRKEVSYPSFVSMINDTVIFTGPTRDTLPDAVSVSGYRRSIFDPGLEQFLHPVFRFDTVGVGNLMTSIYRIFPLTGIHEGKLLIITSQPYPNWYYAPELNLFDTRTKTWLYHSKKVTNPKQNNTGNIAMISNNKIYFPAGREIVCHDIATGQQIWRREFPADFLFSGLNISEGVLVANCENAVLYGIHPDHGSTLWTGQGAGTSSPLQDRVLNGVVYFTGGGPNKVFAVDIRTGKTLWALEASEYDPQSDNWKGDTYVIPGKNNKKGKVVACTAMHCYCFDAAR